MFSWAIVVVIVWLSPLRLCVQISTTKRWTRLSDKVCQWLATGRSVVFSGSCRFLHQYNLPPRYYWNIVESGVKHHHTNKHKNILQLNLHCVCDTNNNTVCLLKRHDMLALPEHMVSLPVFCDFVLVFLF